MADQFSEAEHSGAGGLADRQTEAPSSSRNKKAWYRTAGLLSKHLLEHDVKCT